MYMGNMIRPVRIEQSSIFKTRLTRVYAIFSVQKFFSVQNVFCPNYTLYHIWLEIILGLRFFGWLLNFVGISFR